MTTEQTAEETRIYTLELTRHEALRLAGSAVQQGQQETDFRYWTPDPELREQRQARWDVLTAALKAEGWTPPPIAENAREMAKAAPTAGDAVAGAEAFGATMRAIAKRDAERFPGLSKWLNYANAEGLIQAKVYTRREWRLRQVRELWQRLIRRRWPWVGAP